VDKIKFIFLSLLSFSILTSCSNTINESQNKEKDNSSVIAEDNKTNDSIKEKINANIESENISMDNVTVVDTQLSFLFTYENVEQLIKKSELAVEGIVMSTENYVKMDSETREGIPLTKLTFKINKVLNGNESLKGKKITILEGGGYITAEQEGMKDKFPNLTEKELNEVFFVTIDGHKPSVKGDKLAIFLSNKPNDSEIEFDYYVLTGAYQSKFKYNENSKKYERPSEEFVKAIKETKTKKEKIKTVEEEIQIEEEINTEVTKLVEKTK
jgi:hypothetical protein